MMATQERRNLTEEAYPTRQESDELDGVDRPCFKIGDLIFVAYSYCDSHWKYGVKVIGTKIDSDTIYASQRIAIAAGRVFAETNKFPKGDFEEKER